MSEYILCAAMWVNDGHEHVHQPTNIKEGLVICGWRHHNCIITLSRLASDEFMTKVRENKQRKVQGFLTNKNRFLNRKEAAQLAYENGQIKEPKKELHSEHIY